MIPIPAVKPSFVPFAVVLGLSLFLFLFRLGDRPLRNPDEGRYAEIAKEMVQRHDWVEPRLYGVDYLKKPVLFYWLVAASFRLFGFTEWAARLVPALFGALSVAVTFLFARRLFDSRTAFWASGILVSNGWYLQTGRYLVIDMVFSFFAMAALYAFYLAVTGTAHRRLAWACFYICVALSFLAKGFIGFVVPFVAIGVYALWTRRVTGILKSMRWFEGILICGLIILPWVMQITRREPEFLSFFFFHENVSRFVSSSFEHQAPWYFYFGFLIAIFLPWILFLEPLRRSVDFPERSGKREKLFLWIAGLAPVIFFSLSKSKLPTYILSSIPFFAILVAKGWVDWQSAGMDRKTRAADIGTALFLILLGLVSMAALPVYLERSKNEFVGDTFGFLEGIGFLVTVSASAALYFVLKRNVSGLFYAFTLMFVAVCFPIQSAMQRSNIHYTTKHFAEALRPLVKAGDTVVVYGNPGPFYDFRFYLNHPVRLVGLEGELQFSRKDKVDEETPLTEEELNRIFLEHKPVYCLARRAKFSEIAPEIRKSLTIIKEDDRRVLFYQGAPV